MKRLIPLFAVILVVASAPVFGFDPTRSDDRHTLIDDVIRMSSSGVDDDAIISYVMHTTGVFEVTADDVITLTNAHVSQAVIKAMLDEAAARKEQVERQRAAAAAAAAENDGPLIFYPYYYDPYWYMPRYYSVLGSVGGGVSAAGAPVRLPATTAAAPSQAAAASHPAPARSGHDGGGGGSHGSGGGGGRGDSGRH